MTATGKIERRFAQSLPSQPLMCVGCDSEFGAKLEEPVAKLIASAGFSANPARIYDPPNGPSPCPLAAARYGECLDDANVKHTYGCYAVPSDAVLQFARLCAWRAMHSMARNGHSAVTNYLNSSTGSAAEASAKVALTGGTTAPVVADSIELLIVPPALILNTMSGVDDLTPFAWYWVESQVEEASPVLPQSAVVLWCAHWVTVWQPDFQLHASQPELQYEFVQLALVQTRKQLTETVKQVARIRRPPAFSSSEL